MVLERIYLCVVRGSNEEMNSVCSGVLPLSTYQTSDQQKVLSSTFRNNNRVYPLRTPSCNISTGASHPLVPERICIHIRISTLVIFPKQFIYWISVFNPA